MTYHDGPTKVFTVTASDCRTAFGGPLDGQSFHSSPVYVHDDRGGGRLDSTRIGEYDEGFDIEPQYILQKFGWRVSAGVAIVGYALVRPDDQDARYYVLGGGTLVVALCRMLGGSRA